VYVCVKWRPLRFRPTVNLTRGAAVSSRLSLRPMRRVRAQSYASRAGFHCQVRRRRGGGGGKLNMEKRNNNARNLVERTRPRIIRVRHSWTFKYNMPKCLGTAYNCNGFLNWRATTAEGKPLPKFHLYADRAHVSSSLALPARRIYLLLLRVHLYAEVQ